MDVKRNVPSFIDVAGWRGNVFYDGLKETCFSCQAVGHRRDTCPQKKVRNLTQKEKGKVVSYAGIVAGGELEAGDHSTEDVLEDDIIEVLEESFEQPPEAIVPDQVQPIVDQDVLDREKRRKKSIAVLEGVAKAFQEAMANPQAQQRRSRFAASGSGSSSGSNTVPKKKCARKSKY